MRIRKGNRGIAEVEKVQRERPRGNPIKLAEMKNNRFIF
jgi:hypothetical protein